MKRAPPRSTRTDPLFPDTTRFRSLPGGGFVHALDSIQSPADFWKMPPNSSKKALGKPARLTAVNAEQLAGIDDVSVQRYSFKGANGDTVWGQLVNATGVTGKRSEKMRVGQECVGTGRTRGG